MRNIFKGIHTRETVCDTCGAEWNTKRPGAQCGSALGYKPPFKICKGKVRLK